MKLGGFRWDPKVDLPHLWGILIPHRHQSMRNPRKPPLALFDEGLSLRGLLFFKNLN